MKTYFATCFDYVGQGNTLEEALQDLRRSNDCINFEEVTFYEGTEIKVTLKIKQISIKPKGSNK